MSRLDLEERHQRAPKKKPAKEAMAKVKCAYLLGARLCSCFYPWTDGRRTAANARKWIRDSDQRGCTPRVGRTFLARSHIWLVMIPAANGDSLGQDNTHASRNCLNFSLSIHGGRVDRYRRSPRRGGDFDFNAAATGCHIWPTEIAKRRDVAWSESRLPRTVTSC